MMLHWPVQPTGLIRSWVQIPVEIRSSPLAVTGQVRWAVVVSSFLIPEIRYFQYYANE
jgi:hypothetical protein